MAGRPLRPILALTGTLAAALLIWAPLANAEGHPCTADADTYPIQTTATPRSGILLVPDARGGLGTHDATDNCGAYAFLPAAGGEMAAGLRDLATGVQAGPDAGEWGIAYTIDGVPYLAGTPTSGLPPLERLSSDWTPTGCGLAVASPCTGATIVTRAPGGVEIRETYVPAGLDAYDVTITFTNGAGERVDDLQFRHQIPFSPRDTPTADRGATLDIGMAGEGAWLSDPRPFLASSNGHAAGPLGSGASATESCLLRSGPGAHSGGVPFQSAACATQWSHAELDVGSLLAGGSVDLTVQIGVAHEAGVMPSSYAASVAAAATGAPLWSVATPVAAAAPAFYVAYVPAWQDLAIAVVDSCAGAPTTASATGELGSALTWSWGDGTTTRVQPATATAAHTFASGVFVVTAESESSSGHVVSSAWAGRDGWPHVASSCPPRASLATDTPCEAIATLITGLAASRPGHAADPIVAGVLDLGDGTRYAMAPPFPADAIHHVYADAGVYSITWTVTAQSGLTSSSTSQVVSPGKPCHVDPPQPDLHSPYFEPLAAVVVDPGEPVHFLVHARDPDADDQLLVLTTGVPEGASAPGAQGPASRTTARFDWPSGPSQPGSLKVVFQASDLRGNVATLEVTIVAAATVAPPLPPTDTTLDDPDCVACTAEAGTIAAAPDRDQDGVEDASDNCVSIPNTDQANLDRDVAGDLCDRDLDGDGVAQVGAYFLDNCPFVPNSDQADSDKNQVGDACDAASVAAGTRIDPAKTVDLRDRSPLPDSASLAFVRVGGPLLAVGAGVATFLFLRRLLPTMGLFSRLSKDSLLSHPVRTQLVQAVEASPGIHAQALVRLVDKGRSTVDHHLRSLVNADLLVVRNLGGMVCYFPPNVRAPAATFKSRVGQDVLEEVRRSPGVSLPEVARRLEASAGSVHHHLRRLEQAGLVSLERAGRRLMAFPRASAGTTLVATGIVS